MFIISLGFAKCSVLFFIQRLISRELRRLWSVTMILLGVVAVWTLGSVIALSVVCSSRSFVTVASTCPGQVSPLFYPYENID